ncbi:MAG: hypothetical protein RMM53_10725, partial [Bacteroidia bacterium]|nr:hypothetical protein [Bacteroidia bacterium]
FAEGKNQGFAEGKNQGFAEGLVEGETLGRQNERRELAQKMRDQGFDLEAIAKLTGFTPEQIADL